MLHRIALAALVSAVVLPAPMAHAVGPLPPLPLGLLAPDHLKVTVDKTGNPYANGTYELECGPAGGTHPEAERACEHLRDLSRARIDPFAPTGRRQMCTRQYGGPATAHVTGTWHGRRIDAHFSRRNGCEIERWDRMEPVLPSARS
ncbi:SSI family serine proteinase inhibitor [Streptomyces sp. NPDC006879]|uniref:SSI family serine proteinase inhibitor n=1 Tax=Streptomyces sp. NPDC006879 TaxID=3364767 RepID=UPI00368F813F